MLKVARLLVLLSALFVSGIPEGAWQAYAWAAMMVERVPGMGVVEALEDTLSGESPCEICEALEEHRSQKKDTPPEEGVDLKNVSDKFLEREGFIVLYEPSFVLARYWTSRGEAMSWVDDLHSPPPRLG